MKEVVLSKDTLSKALESSGLKMDLGKFLNLVEEESNAVIKESSRSKNHDQRVEEWKKSLSEDKKALALKLNELTSSLTKEHMKVVLQEPRMLSQFEIDELAEEYEVYREVKEALEARYAMYREYVNWHVNIQNENSEEVAGIPPEQTKGRLEGEKFTFCREGGGRKSPSVDWNRLKDSLTEEQWSEVTDSEHIPGHYVKAHDVQTPNEDKLMDAVYAGKLDLEVLREVLVPGSWTTPKFVIRPTKKEES